MPRNRSRGPKTHKFMNKLLLNQWLISLFGIDPLVEQRNSGKVVRPFHKLADQEGPNTIATRSLGDQNLLLVDEGHRGMSGKEEGVWFTRRSNLCAKGFTIEYSATFEQAVQASGNAEFENSYAKAVIIFALSDATAFQLVGWVEKRNPTIIMTAAGNDHDVCKIFF